MIPARLRLWFRRYIRSPASAGFTLVEMLVVIAIIAVLAGLMLPALAAAKVRAQAVGCTSNLRRLQLGWQMYANDFNDILLPNAPADARFQNPTQGSYANTFAWCGISPEGWEKMDANARGGQNASTPQQTPGWR